MARDATVRTVLTASDQASGPLRNFQNTIRGVKTEMGDMNDVAGMLKGGIAGIAAAAGVDALMQLGQGAMELGRAGEQASILRDAFEQTAAGVGAASASMLSSLQAASGGMIADTDLMLAANRAMMLGVADSADEMGQLLEVAAVRGRAMGLSTSQAFNDLVTGLGRMSPLILDNLGIVTGGEAVFTQYAASIGKAADALTDAERKQALFNKVVASTDTSGELVVSQFERMDAAIQNAKTAMGELFGPAVAVIAQALADGVTVLLNNAKLAGDELALTLADLEGRAATFQDVYSRSLGDPTNVDTFAQEQAEAFDRLHATLVAVSAAMEDGVPAATQWMTTLRGIADESLKSGQVSEDNITKINGLTVALRAATSEINFTGSAYDQLSNSTARGSVAFQEAAAKLDYLGLIAAGTAGDIATLDAAVAGLSARMAGMAPIFAQLNSIKSGAQGQLQSMAMQLIDQGADPEEVIAKYGEAAYTIQNLALSTDASSESMLRNRLLVEGQLDPWQDWSQALTDTNKAAGDFASQGAKDLESAISDLQGKVQGALSEAISLDVSWPGKDGADDSRDINENARRMAAIANEGLIGQDWLGDLANEAPAAYADLMLKIAAGADAKSAAQSIMEDFQAGLRPDMLNLDALKEDIKNQIAGEAAMAATAAQITAELVADTGGDSADIQAKVNKALGLGVKSTELTDGIVGQLNSSTFNSQLNTAASGGGKAWGNTFLATVEQNVPPALVALLVNLVTPGVQSNIATQDSLTGPTE